MDRSKLIGEQATRRCSALCTGAVAGIMLVLFLHGCAPASSQQKKTQGIQNATATEQSRQESVSSIGGPDVIVHSPLKGVDPARLADIQVSVTKAKPPELESLFYLSDQEAVGIIFASTALVGAGFAALALPLLAADAAGLTVMGSAGLGIEGYRSRPMKKALASVDLVDAMTRALRRRLETGSPPSGNAPAAELEVTIVAYGFVASSHHQGCYFIDVRTLWKVQGQADQEDWIVMEPVKRSDDAPPAFCTHAKRLSSNDAELAKQVISESAEIVAAVLAHRIREGAK